MKRMAAVFLASMLLASVAESQTTPFAEPRRGPSPVPSQLSLGNMMTLIQARHIKLWYAGQGTDWPLAEYELNHIAEDLTAAAMLYTMIPIELVAATDAPLTAMRDAARAKDLPKFQAGYAALTAACNACHQAGNVGFIRIQTPLASPFTDQDLLGSARR